MKVRIIPVCKSLVFIVLPDRARRVQARLFFPVAARGLMPNDDTDKSQFTHVSIHANRPAAPHKSSPEVIAY
jgi:hypothetical protein